VAFDIREPGDSMAFITGREEDPEINLEVRAAEVLLLGEKGDAAHSDTRMVEKYYGHLTPTALGEAVKTYTPKLGIFGKKEAKKGKAVA